LDLTTPKLQYEQLKTIPLARAAGAAKLTCLTLQKMHVNIAPMPVYRVTFMKLSLTQRPVLKKNGLGRSSEFERSMT
jgi:hypothetical protein